MASKTQPTVAVVGGGISGIYAAHLLQKQFAVTIFESSQQLGGHACWVETEFRGNPILLDMAFLIFNRHSYPKFWRFLQDLGVSDKTTTTEMSFLIENDQSCFAINGRTESLAALYRNFLKPSHLKMYYDLLRFRRQAFHDLHNNRLEGLTIAEYLQPYGRFFKEHFIQQIAIAVWSLPPHHFWHHPAKNFIRFLMHHNYLVGHPGRMWRSFPFSSRTYIDAFKKNFRGTIRLSEKVETVQRIEPEVELITAKGMSHTFDYIVLALHPHHAIKILADPTHEELRLLTPWRYFSNRVVLHTDASVLPHNRKLWCSWNVRSIAGTNPMVTYYLNRVQNLYTAQDYFVTLGEHSPRINSQKIIAEREFAHPIFEQASYATQKELSSLNQERTYFCGAYFGYGFHEDGLNAAEKACQTLTANHQAAQSSTSRERVATVNSPTFAP